MLAADTPDGEAPTPETGGGMPAAPLRPPPPPPPAAAPQPTSAAGLEGDGSSPAQEGEIRLVGRVDVNGFATGAVQVFRNGIFGAVCTEDFGDPEARVACRQLGFPSGTVLRSLFTEDGFTATQQEIFFAPFVLGALGCSGEEARLVDCALAVESDYGRYAGAYREVYEAREFCFSLPDSSDSPSFAAVACGLGTGAEEGDLRLVDGVTAEDVSAQFGRLELFSNGGWGTVCGFPGRGAFFDPAATFSQASSAVACRQLGFSDGVYASSSREDSFFSDSTPQGDDSILRRVPIVRPGSNCSGTEATLAECPLPDNGAPGRTGLRLCSHRDDVLLTCFSGPSDQDGAVRLSRGEAGPGYEYGRLEVFMRGLWSDICSMEQFTPASAGLACRLLGYDGGSRLLFDEPYAFGSVGGQSYTVFPESRPVALADVDCVGNEASLLDCPSRSSSAARCVNSSDATIVACGNTDAECNVTSPEVEGSVRLVSGLGTACDPLHTGTVEIFHAGEWGAICVNTIDQRLPVDTLAADTVCRQLGFPHGTPVSTLVPVPLDLRSSRDFLLQDLVESSAPGRVWLEGLNCLGGEQSVLECELDPPDFASDAETCFGAFLESEDDYSSYDGRESVRLAVACRQFAVQAAAEALTTPGAMEGDIRLVDEEAVGEWVIGKPEIFFEGSWHQVCAALFDRRDAAVACRQLGLGAASFPSQITAVQSGLQFSPGGSEAFVAPDVALSQLGCSGTEASLLDCPRQNRTDRLNPFPQCRVPANPSADRILSIACVAAPVQGEEGAVRMAAPMGEVGGSMVGTLEIFHAGAWGSICTEAAFQDYGSEITVDGIAQVACQQLGFTSGQIDTFFRAPAEQPVPPLWLQDLQCAGTEATIADCNRTTFGDVQECFGGAVRLTCSIAGLQDGQIRLEDGGADPGGAWEYGRLEEAESGLWVPRTDDFDVYEGAFNATDAVGACAALGYTAGAQMLGNDVSPFPGSELVEPNRLAQLQHTVLMCANPIGCDTGEAGPPAEGDVRLIPVTPTGTPTAECDPVHFGGVEVFTGGRWERLCNGEDFPDVVGDALHILAAQVICRQLGFSFWGLMDADTSSSFDEDYVEGAERPEGVPVAANFAKCSGLEERISDCVFRADDNDDFVPLGEVEGSFGRPVRGACAVDATATLSVICRQFPIVGSNVIR